MFASLGEERGEPGCYPTGGSDWIRPLVDAGIIPKGLSHHNQRRVRLLGRRKAMIQFARDHAWTGVSNCMGWDLNISNVRKTRLYGD